mmetsp:Transcript_10255/g.62705  ORF Transcript_10255/g.62705 Transcript_10255/m.62705 type:complete len:249 (-) Transcript_10255:1140-1886(-)
MLPKVCWRAGTAWRRSGRDRCVGRSGHRNCHNPLGCHQDKAHGARIGKSIQGRARLCSQYRAGRRARCPHERRERSCGMDHLGRLRLFHLPGEVQGILRSKEKGGLGSVGAAPIGKAMDKCARWTLCIGGFPACHPMPRVLWNGFLKDGRGSIQYFFVRFHAASNKLLSLHRTAPYSRSCSCRRRSSLGFQSGKGGWSTCSDGSAVAVGWRGRPAEARDKIANCCAPLHIPSSHGSHFLALSVPDVHC